MLDAEINGEMKNGKDQKSSIDTIRAIRLEREKMVLQASISREQNVNQAVGMLSIASALCGRRRSDV